MDKRTKAAKQLKAHIDYMQELYDYQAWVQNILDNQPIEVTNMLEEALAELEEERRIDVPKIYTNEKDEMFVDEGNMLNVRETRRKVGIFFRCYLKATNSHGDIEIRYNDHPRATEKYLEVEIDENGKFDVKEIIEIYINDKGLEYLKYIRENDQLGYDAYIYYSEHTERAKDVDGINIYDPDVNVVSTYKAKKRSLKYDIDYNVYAHTPYLYECMQNLISFKHSLGMSCFKNVFNELGIECDEQNMTRQRFMDIVKQHRSDVYFVGYEPKPSDKTYAYQIVQISQHIYISKKTIIKSPKTISETINNLEPKICLDIAAKKREYLEAFYVPYEIPGQLLIMEKEMHVSPDQMATFDMCKKFYGKRYSTFSFYKLMKPLQMSIYELVEWKYKPINWVGAMSGCVCHIDQEKSYPRAFDSLDAVYSISGVKARYWPIHNETRLETGNYYQVQFELTGNSLMDEILQSKNVISYKSFRLYVKIAKVLGVEFSGEIQFEYELFKIKYDHKLIGQKIQTYLPLCKETDYKLHCDQCTEYNSKCQDCDKYAERQEKIMKNSMFGLLTAKTETKGIAIQDINIVDGQVRKTTLNVFNKEQVQQSNADNSKFIHCQMINNQFVRLFQDYVDEIKNIIAIKTDSLFFNKMPKEIDTEIFRVEKDLEIRMHGKTHTPTKEECVPTVSKPNEKIIIQASAGQGKTRYIRQTADKENDVVICVSIANKQQYLDDGFKNVYVYHFLRFINMFEFLLNYENIYCDEWIMMPADFIYKLLSLDLSIIFVGDIQQNYNRDFTEGHYRAVMDKYPTEQLDTKGQRARNDIRIERYYSELQQTMESQVDDNDRKELILYDMKNDISVVMAKDVDKHDWLAEFAKPDLLVMAIDNKTVFKINNLYQNSPNLGQIIHKVHSLRHLSPQRFDRHDDNGIYYAGKKRVNNYYGCARTIYLAQGQQAQNIVVIINGHETFRQLYVAYTRWAPSREAPILTEGNKQSDGVLRKRWCRCKLCGEMLNGSDENEMEYKGHWFHKRCANDNARYLEMITSGELNFPLSK